MRAEGAFSFIKFYANTNTAKFPRKERGMQRQERRADFIIESDGLVGRFEVGGKIDIFVASKNSARIYIREAGACGTYFSRDEQEKLRQQVSRALRMATSEDQVPKELVEIIKNLNRDLEALQATNHNHS